jgi:CRISPR/Cas system CSM-associated protein Csm3 (group 7 of RAMP superfamily)
MNGNNGVAAVVLAGEQSFSFKAIYKVAQRGEFAAEIVVNVLALRAQVEVGGDVSRAAGEVSFSGEKVFEALLLAHYLLGFLRIRPEIGVGSLLLDFG